MTNYGTPVPLQVLADFDDIPENLRGGYVIEGYSLAFDPAAAGRWFHLFDGETHAGVVWTDDDDACGVIALRRPDFDSASYSATALALRLLHDAGAPATDAFNIIAAEAKIPEVSVGPLSMVELEIVT